MTHNTATASNTQENVEQSWGSVGFQIFLSSNTGELSAIPHTCNPWYSVGRGWSSRNCKSILGYKGNSRSAYMRLRLKKQQKQNKTHHHRQQKTFRAESLQRVGLGMGNLTPVFGTIDASLLIARASVGLEGGGGGNAALPSCLLSLPRQLPEHLCNRQAHWLRLS